MNKLVIQQVKTTFYGLPTQELDKLVTLLIKQGIQKSYKQIGYKCVECTFQFKGLSVSGFGREDSEATHNCIKNFVDSLLEQDDVNSVAFVKNILKELKQCNQEDDELEVLGLKIGNISIIQNQNYQTVDSLVNIENDQTLLNVIKDSQYVPNNKGESCNCKQELKKEKQKIENLELRMNLIMEENRILKQMLNEQNSTHNAKKDSNRQEYSSRMEDTKRIRQQTRSTSAKMPITGKIPKLNLDVLPNYHNRQKTTVTYQQLF